MLKSIIFASIPPYFSGIVILNSGGVLTSTFIKLSDIPLIIIIKSFNKGIFSSIIAYMSSKFASNISGLGTNSILNIFSELSGLNNCKIEFMPSAMS